MRPENWEQLLEGYETKCREKPFIWGDFDCVICGCNEVKLLTNIDMAKPVRGKYDSEAKARKVLKKYGTLRNTAIKWCKKHGFERLKYPLTAQRGDLVLLKGSEGSTLGFISLNGRPVAPALEGGLVELGFSAISVAWRIE